MTTEAPSTALARAVAGLEVDAAKSLQSAFSQMFGQADEWIKRASEIRVTDEGQKREMKLARESRLALKEIRTTAEATRKRLKEDSLRKGKAIDGIANVLKALIEPIEAHLLEQETFAERAQKARVDALDAARVEALRALGDQKTYADLGVLTDEGWSCVLQDAKDAKAAREERVRMEEAARVEAAKIVAQREAEARAQRLKDDAERKAREEETLKENERLRAELAAKTSAPDGKPVPVQTADRPSYGLSAAEAGERGPDNRDEGRVRPPDVSQRDKPGETGTVPANDVKTGPTKAKFYLLVEALKQIANRSPEHAHLLARTALEAVGEKP